MQETIKALNNRFRTSDPVDTLTWFAENYPGKVAFSSSLGAEDQVITHMIAGITPKVRIFTLDTGRLFQETYDLLQITNKKYNLEIELFFPDRDEVENMVRSKGINLFYESVQNRQECCHIRKIQPLRRALQGMEVWITGMRREQSVTRQHAGLLEWDEVNQIIKLNILAGWDASMVWDYIRNENIPVSELHAKGFPSIGCLPCTRAVQPGEDVRSGRWWWELPEFKECGLHKKP